MEKLSQTTIYVGLNDSVSGEQKYVTQKYLSILKKVCSGYSVAFSVYPINGGYFHEDGRYVEETTLALMLIGVGDDILMEIAKDLCVFFNQESVMVVSSPCSVVFVSEEL